MRPETGAKVKGVSVRTLKAAAPTQASPGLRARNVAFPGRYTGVRERSVDGEGAASSQAAVDTAVGMRPLLSELDLSGC
jgi:hypothetical protein